MNEKLICISTPKGRCYYRATALAKEFLDKDQNIINTTGQIPDGEVEEFKLSTKTVKHYKNGKLDGSLEIIDLTNDEVTFSEEYKNGVLIDLSDHTLHGSPLPVIPPPSPKYLGTLVKSNKSTLSFYVNGKEVAEQTLSTNGSVLEQLGEIPDGPVREIDENGVIRLEAVYRANQREGLVKRYNERGELISQETYTHGELNGPSQYYSYYLAGKFTVFCQYAHGLLQGKWVAATPNGKAHTVALYEKGKLQGERTAFYQNGNIHIQETFENGKLNGPRILYFLHGEIWYREQYKNGRLDGERITFFPNGQKAVEESYADGLLEGPRKMYNENGQLLLSEEYHWGVLLTNTERKAKR